jgi:hypothetical protein
MVNHGSKLGIVGCWPVWGSADGLLVRQGLQGGAKSRSRCGKMANVNLRVFWNVASGDRSGAAHCWTAMTGDRKSMTLTRALCGRRGRPASFFRRATNCAACEARQVDVLHLLSDVGASVGYSGGSFKDGEYLGQVI